MCGIYGMVDLRGGPVDARALEAMARVAVHRGPDDQGEKVDGACAIGIRRLSIIDVAGGHQPITNADESLWVVCNGEIYNFRELRETLESLGYRFKTRSDTEVVLHGYAAWGDEFVHHLNGMFGFALWDVRRQRLVVGRDRLGIKPVYYAVREGCFAFASEAKSLVAADPASSAADPAGLRAYLELGYVPAPLSMFRGIAKLPPASMLVVQDGRFEIRRYWRPPANVDTGPSVAEWTERVRAQLEQSVRMQMVSDVPLGAFLSGGVDSSAMLAFMAKASDRPIRTYSIGFSGSRADAYYNELPYARAVANQFGAKHRELLVKPDVARLLPRLLWHMDEPIADSAFITTYLVSEFAREEVKVILSGVGGDEVFGGYRRYLGDHYQGLYQRLPGFLRAAAARGVEMLPSDRHSPLANFGRYAKSFVATVGMPLERRYRSYIEVFSSAELGALLVDTSWQTLDAIATAFREAPGSDAVHRLMTVDLATQLPDDVLMLTDKMSMAASLECRVPLLDHELVELAARIPMAIKVAGGELKHLIKRALDGVLPDSVLNRPKRGFGAPIGAWMRSELAGLLGEALDRRSIARRGWFHPEAVEALIGAHERKEVDGTDRLLALLNLEIWARVYLDCRTPEDVATEIDERLRSGVSR